MRRDAERVEKLINAVGHPNFGALVDIGNFACADEDSARSVGIMAPYAFHSHAKISIRRTAASTTPAKAGSSPAPAITSAARSSVTATCRSDSASTRFRRGGYDGYMMIEFEGMEDPIRGITVGYNNLKRFIG